VQQSRQGVLHFRIRGERGKIRFVPVRPAAQTAIEDYLCEAGHRADLEGTLFFPVKKKRRLSAATSSLNTAKKRASAPKLQGLAFIRCAPRRRRTRSRTKAISRKCRNG